MTADEQIRQLLARGLLVQAAELLEQSAQHERAAEVYEQLWDYRSAARAAEAAADYPRALKNLLRARDDESCARLVTQTIVLDRTYSARCAVACEELGRFDVAAELHQAAGALREAARCLERAGFSFEAAQLFEAAGDARRAISLYRQLLARHDDGHTRVDPATWLTAKAHLGQLLLRAGRPHDAVVLLQRAWREGGMRSAGRGTAVALHRLGYPSAARYALECLGAGDDSPAPTVDELVHHPDFAVSYDANDDGAQLLAGRYRLGPLIGAGGAGRVYHATDELERRDVAVKVFTAPAGARGRDAFRRFEREARIAGSLHHPHIVSVLELNEQMGFMVLEHMAGGTLSERIQIERLSLGACQSIVLQLLDGLAAAHQRGIVHRDIKPSNTFFSAAGTAKLGDFGVAHLQDTGQTQTAALVGTLAFMAPEQIVGGDITFATDVYAIGVTLFVMLTGRPPFGEPDLITKQVTAPASAPSSIVPELPSAYDEVVLRCLAKAPEDRFPSLRELRRAVGELPVSHTHARATAPPGLARASDAAPPPVNERRYDGQGAFATRDNAELTVEEAIDRSLGRAVYRVHTGNSPHAIRARTLLSTAAKADRHELQRVLFSDPEQHTWLLAKPYGEQLSPADCNQSPAALRRALQVARAIAPLHHEHLAHGALTHDALCEADGMLVVHLILALLAPVDATPTTDLLQLATVFGLPHDAIHLGTVDGLIAWLEEALAAELEEETREVVDGIVAAAMDRKPAA